MKRRENNKPMTKFQNDPRIKIIKVCPKQETLSINKVIVCSPLPEDGKGQLTDWLAGRQSRSCVCLVQRTTMSDGRFDQRQ